MKTIILSIIGILIILHIFDQKQNKPTEDINSLLINSIKDLNPLKHINRGPILKSVNQQSNYNY